jgi:hypothetical protein
MRVLRPMHYSPFEGLRLVSKEKNLVPAQASTSRKRITHAADIAYKWLFI